MWVCKCKCGGGVCGRGCLLIKKNKKVVSEMSVCLSTGQTSYVSPCMLEYFSAFIL